MIIKISQISIIRKKSNKSLLISKIEKKNSVDDMAETDAMKLLDFPDEILLEIFRNFSDHSLLHAVCVCKRFQIIAKASFAQKYNGVTEKHFYSLEISAANLPDECEQYRRIFRNFGDCMHAINIGFIGDVVSKNHWLVALIQRYCNSITKLKIKNGEAVDLTNIISHLTNLSELFLNDVRLLDHKWTECMYPKLIRLFACNTYLDINAFIGHNAQLEHLSLYHFKGHLPKVINYVNGRLSELKTLDLFCEKIDVERMESISPMKNLNSLTVAISKNSFQPLISAVRAGFTKIENLELYEDEDWFELRPSDINLLCSFTTLKSLSLTDSFVLSFPQLKILVAHLSQLVSFSLGNAQNLCGTPDDILNVVSVCHKLSRLELNIGKQPELEFNFCVRFADMMEMYGSKLKMELAFHKTDNMIFTREESRIIRDRHDDTESHHIIYWKGYEAFNAPNPTDKKFLELERDVLTKIFTYLDVNALSAIFQTCKHLRHLVIQFLHEPNVFRCTLNRENPTKENVFVVLGKYIRRIAVDLNFDYINQAIEGNADYLLFKSVHRYCGTNVTELKIYGHVPIKANLWWPNLRKLKLSDVSIEKLRMFRCPELTHLCIDLFEEGINNDHELWTNSFPKLSTLKLKHYDELTESFLSSFDESLCNQVIDLCIIGWFNKNRQHRSWLKLTNIVVRFRHLIALHLHVNGIEESNFKFLFENCLKLVDLTISVQESFEFDKYSELCRIVKLNCKRIENIQLVVGRSSYFYLMKETFYRFFPNATINFTDTSCKCKRLSDIL